jgi:hypothetical protein
MKEPASMDGAAAGGASQGADVAPADTHARALYRDGAGRDGESVTDNARMAKEGSVESGGRGREAEVEEVVGCPAHDPQCMAKENGACIIARACLRPHQIVRERVCVGIDAKQTLHGRARKHIHMHALTDICFERARAFS